MAFLLVLERLSPVERAVFLLHDVFSYGYEEIARIVGKSEDNCRQLALRARRHVTEHKPRFEASRRKRKNSPPGSSARWGREHGRPASPCSPRTSWSTATAAESAHRGRVPSPGATAWSGSWRASAARSASSGSRPGASRSTDSPGRCSSIRLSRLTNVFVLDIADGRVQTRPFGHQPGKAAPPRAARRHGGPAPSAAPAGTNARPQVRHRDWGSLTEPARWTGAEGGGTTGPMSPSGASSRSTITGAWSLGAVPLRAWRSTHAAAHPASHRGRWPAPGRSASPGPGGTSRPGSPSR